MDTLGSTSTRGAEGQMPPIFYKGDSQNPDFNSLADLRDRLKELLTRDQAEFLLSMQGRQKVQQELKRRAKRALNGTMVDLGLHSQWGKGAYKAYKAAAEAVLKRKQQPADRAQDSSSRVTSAGLSLSGPGGLIAALLGLGVLAGGGYALSQFTDIRESYGNRRLA